MDVVKEVEASAVIRFATDETRGAIRPGTDEARSET